VKPARLASLAYELAATPVEDAALARELGIDEKAVGRYGAGRGRFFAPDGTGPAELAAGAARAALAEAGVAPDAVDYVVFATNTPDYTFPGSACLLQAQIGCRDVGCLDVRAMCSGFLVGLDLARRYVATGTYGTVLLAVGEVPSHQARFDGVDPALACLTADAACAAVVTSGGAGMVVSAVRAELDGSKHRAFWCEFPASRNLCSAGVRGGDRLTREAIVTG
jgi:3-oxoacyl-[acyl-carrier-protein] synthase III